MTGRALVRGGWLMLLAAIPVFAQFAELKATDDGKTLYFTSEMLFQGEKATLGWPEYRLYRFTSGAVTLFAERGASASNSTFSSTTGVTGVSTTGDGSLVGFTLTALCVNGNPSCMSPVDEAQLRGSQTSDLGPGPVQISRNGHWALLTNVTYDDAVPPNQTVTYTLIDLTTGGRTKVQQNTGRVLPPGLGNQIASDGTALVFPADGSAPLLSKQALSKPAPGVASGVNLIAISDDGSTLFGYAWANAPQLVAVDVASAKVTPIATAAGKGQTVVLLGDSNNGQRVLYAVQGDSAFAGAAYVWDAATGATIPVLLDAGEMANAGTLSGLGDTAFVATTRGRVVTMPVRSGAAVTALFPATPYCDDPGPVAGGSLVQLHCTFDIPVADLAGKSWYQGWPLPVVYEKTGNLGVQIPWAWDNFVPKLVTFDIPSPSGFQPSQVLSVWDGAPTMLMADGGLFGVLMVKADWSGLVTVPPKAGDIVYVYMLGLGPVTGDVQTGVAAPVGSLRPIQWGLSCQFVPQTAPADVLFAGLAPGMIGVYQVTLRVPSDPAAMTNLQCTLTAGRQGVTFGPGLPTYGIRSGAFGFGGPGIVP
jgi:uncharacterized protein (TIGR03437 family)